MKLIYGILILALSCKWVCAQSSDGDIVIDYHATEEYEEIENRLSQSRDTIYVINYWATWCKPCVEEMPYFLEMERKNANKEVKLILVSLDFPGQEEKALFPYLQENNISTEVWHIQNMNYNAWLDQVDSSWSGALPSTQVRWQDERLFKEGSFHSLEELEEFVESIGK